MKLTNFKLFLKFLCIFICLSSVIEARRFSLKSHFKTSQHTIPCVFTMTNTVKPYTKEKIHAELYLNLVNNFSEHFKIDKKYENNQIIWGLVFSYRDDQILHKIVSKITHTDYTLPDIFLKFARKRGHKEIHNYEIPYRFFSSCNKYSDKIFRCILTNNQGESNSLKIKVLTNHFKNENMNELIDKINFNSLYIKNELASLKDQINESATNFIQAQLLLNKFEEEKTKGDIANFKKNIENGVEKNKEKLAELTEKMRVLKEQYQIEESNLNVKKNEIEKLKYDLELNNKAIDYNIGIIDYYSNFSETHSKVALEAFKDTSNERSLIDSLFNDFDVLTYDKTGTLKTAKDFCLNVYNQNHNTTLRNFYNEIMKIGNSNIF